MLVLNTVELSKVVLQGSQESRVVGPSPSLQLVRDKIAATTIVLPVTVMDLLTVVMPYLEYLVSAL